MYESTVEMAAQYGRTVPDGSFRGMKYPMSSLLSRHGIPILFGTYELKLHPIIDDSSSGPATTKKAVVPGSTLALQRENALMSISGLFVAMISPRKRITFAPLGIVHWS